MTGAIVPHDHGRPGGRGSQVERYASAVLDVEPAQRPVIYRQRPQQARVLPREPEPAPPPRIIWVDPPEDTAVVEPARQTVEYRQRPTPTVPNLGRPIPERPPVMGTLVAVLLSVAGAIVLGGILLAGDASWTLAAIVAGLYTVACAALTYAASQSVWRYR